MLALIEQKVHIKLIMMLSKTDNHNFLCCTLKTIGNMMYYSDQTIVDLKSLEYLDVM